jgi:hypothetical protein
MGATIGAFLYTATVLTYALLTRHENNRPKANIATVQIHEPAVNNHDSNSSHTTEETRSIDSIELATVMQFDNSSPPDDITDGITEDENSQLNNMEPPDISIIAPSAEIASLQAHELVEPSHPRRSRERTGHNLPRRSSSRVLKKPDRYTDIPTKRRKPNTVRPQ